MGFDFFEPPGTDQLCEALLLLHALGALDGRTGKLTPRVGRVMARLPLGDPCLARTLLEAAGRGVLDDAIAIAAMLSTEAIWHKRSKHQRLRLLEQ